MFSDLHARCTAPIVLGLTNRAGGGSCGPVVVRFVRRHLVSSSSVAVTFFRQRWIRRCCRARSSRARPAEAMLKKRADPNKVNAKSKTPLDLVQTSQSPALVKLLRQYGAKRHASTAQDRRTGRWQGIFVSML